MRAGSLLTPVLWGLLLMAMAAWLLGFCFTLTAPHIQMVGPRGNITIPRGTTVPRRGLDDDLARALAYEIQRQAGQEVPIIDQRTELSLGEARMFLEQEALPLLGPGLTTALSPESVMGPIPALPGQVAHNPDLAALIATHPKPGSMTRIPPVTGEGDVKVIILPGTWATIPWLGNGTTRLRIIDRSGGHHGARIQAEDWGSVRFNGGFIGPMRLYVIPGEIVIEGTGLIQVDIRPLGAAHAYWVGPIRIPRVGG